MLRCPKPDTREFNDKAAKLLPKSRVSVKLSLDRDRVEMVSSFK